MLQTRTGKRTAQAALKIAVSLVQEGGDRPREAIRRVEPASLDQLLHPMLRSIGENDGSRPRVAGIAGRRSGKVVFSADEAESFAARGEAVILVRIETSPEDIHGMHAAKGVLTSRGGMTSHAAVVARGMGRPCVAGAGDLRIDYEARTMAARSTLVKGGRDHHDRRVHRRGDGRRGADDPAGAVGRFRYIDGLGGRDPPSQGARQRPKTAIDARAARWFGAEGIGLSRTEHMFFEADRIGAMRRVIMAEDEAGRRAGLADLLPIQREDFAEIFRIMRDCRSRSVYSIRRSTNSCRRPKRSSAKWRGLPVKTLRRSAIVRWHCTRPILCWATRGCRLGITYPEIYEMQAAAIFEAAVAVVKEMGEAVEPEIMVPLIATKKEFDILRAMIDRVGKEVMEREGTVVPYLVGTMIELPRAALLAGENRRDGGVLQLWDERFDPDGLWSVAGRRREFRRDLPAARDIRARPVRHTRCDWGRRARAHRSRAGPRHHGRTETGHLRRAWRRSGFDCFLP